MREYARDAHGDFLGKTVGTDNECGVNYETVGRSTEFGGVRVSWRGQAPIVERFWSRVNKTRTCWLWTGTILSHGYGQISLGHPSTPGSKRWRAHRFSWELHNGLVPAGMVVCHRCDTPACVNPAHLFLGSQKANMHDAIRKGRRNAFGHQKLNEADVLVIRAQAARGIGRKDIAQAFGIAPHTVTQIVHRRSWQHLPPAAADAPALGAGVAPREHRASAGTSQR